MVEVHREDEAAWAMIAVNPEKGEPAVGWVLDILSEGIGGRRLRHYIVDLIEPISRAQCVLDAEQALSVEYTVSPNSPPPLARAEYSWNLALK